MTLRYVTDAMEIVAAFCEQREYVGVYIGKNNGAIFYREWPAGRTAIADERIDPSEKSDSERKRGDPMNPTQTYTRGPWHWRHFGDNLVLATKHSGSLIVMDFVRRGFRGAEPRFGKRTDNAGGLMMKSGEILEADWDHPDMRMIAAAPMLYEALKAIQDSEHQLPSGLLNKINAACRMVEG